MKSYTQRYGTIFVYIRRGKKTTEEKRERERRVEKSRTRSKRKETNGRGYTSLKNDTGLPQWSSPCFLFLLSSLRLTLCLSLFFYFLHFLLIDIAVLPASFCFSFSFPSTYVFRVVQLGCLAVNTSRGLHGLSRRIWPANFFSGNG